MALSSAVRLQIESALAQKIPSALTPAARMVRPVAATGIGALDELLNGGLPVGALSELVGPEGSGRTSVALSFLAGMTRAARVCAWIDVSNTLDPASAAATGVDLDRLLWVRCGAQSQRAPQEAQSFILQQKYLAPPPAKRGLHGGGFGPHPRSEANGLPEAVSGLLRPEIQAGLVPQSPQARAPQARVPKASALPLPVTAPCAEPQDCGVSSATQPKGLAPSGPQPPVAGVRTLKAARPWSRMDQALRATDLLLQAGGFSAIVLDMGSLAPEAVSRVPLATWFRYRAAAERTQSSIVLLTPYACAKSSAELLLRLSPGQALGDEATLFTGLAQRVEIVRRRFSETPTNVLPMRKPPQRAQTAHWPSRAAWAGCR